MRGPRTLEDMSYGTGIELRLPANWNHRFFFQGGGGLNGVLLPAVRRGRSIPLRARARLRGGLDRQRPPRQELDRLALRRGSAGQARLRLSGRRAHHVASEVAGHSLLRTEAGLLVLHGLLHRRPRSDARRAAPASRVRWRRRGQSVLQPDPRRRESGVEPAERHPHRPEGCERQAGSVARVQRRAAESGVRSSVEAM